MNFGMIIGQVFRDASGMPPKVSTYNSRLKVYDGITSDIDEVEKLVIKYFEESGNIDWGMIQAKKIKLDSDVKNVLISSSDYVSESNALYEEKESILDDFISSASDFFVTSYKNKLYTVKKRYSNDPYIEPMEFDTWFDMKGARNLAHLASLQIRCSDEYVDAAKIAEIFERYKRERHMRRGR